MNTKTKNILHDINVLRMHKEPISYNLKTLLRPLIFVLFGTVFGVLSTLLLLDNFFVGKNTGKNSTIVQPTQTATPKEINKNVKIELTEFFYIGPKTFQLAYEYENKGEQVPDMARYVLYDYKQTERYVLREESLNACGFGNIFKSTTVDSSNTVKILVSYHCGDAPQIILIGIKYGDIKWDNYNPILSAEIIASKEIDLGDSYYKPQKILGWINLNEILVKETIIDPEGAGPDQTKYWKVNIDNPTQRSSVNI